MSQALGDKGETQRRFMETSSVEAIHELLIEKVTSGGCDDAMVRAAASSLCQLTRQPFKGCDGIVDRLLVIAEEGGARRLGCLVCLGKLLPNEESATQELVVDRICKLTSECVTSSDGRDADMRVPTAALTLLQRALGARRGVMHCGGGGVIECLDVLGGLLGRGVEGGKAGHLSGALRCVGMLASMNRHALEITVRGPRALHVSVQGEEGGEVKSVEEGGGGEEGGGRGEGQEEEGEGKLSITGSAPRAIEVSTLWDAVRVLVSSMDPTLRGEAVRSLCSITAALFRADERGEDWVRGGREMCMGEVLEIVSVGLLDGSSSVVRLVLEGVEAIVAASHPRRGEAHNMSNRAEEAHARLTIEVGFPPRFPLNFFSSCTSLCLRSLHTPTCPLTCLVCLIMSTSQLLEMSLSLASHGNVFWGVSVAKLNAISASNFAALFRATLRPPLYLPIIPTSHDRNDTRYLPPCLDAVSSAQDAVLSSVLESLESKHFKVRDAAAQALEKLASNCLFSPGIARTSIDFDQILSVALRREVDADFCCGAQNMSFIVAALQDRLALPQVML
jgi:hypothetical protein